MIERHKADRCGSEQPNFGASVLKLCVKAIFLVTIRDYLNNQLLTTWSDTLILMPITWLYCLSKLTEFSSTV
jgi:hypothetical protein